MSKKDLVGCAGIGLCILSILFGLYIGLWVCVVGGVAAIINGIGTDPMNGVMVGLGVLRFTSAGIVGMISFFVLWASGLSIINISDNMD